MRVSPLLIPKLTLILGVGLAAFVLSSTCSQTAAQDARRGGDRALRSNAADQTEQEQAKVGQPKLTDYELVWETIETHQTSTLQVFGQDFKFESEFKNGEAPFFNAFEEELEPGKYNYSIKFIPNEIGEYKATIADIRNERTDLLKSRRAAIESGDRDLAKTMYQRSCELRKEASEMASQHMTVDKKTTHKFIKKHGQIVVDEDGSIKVYDLEKIRRDARDAAKEKQEAERAENRESEEPEIN